MIKVLFPHSTLPLHLLLSLNISVIHSPFLEMLLFCIYLFFWSFFFIASQLSLSCMLVKLLLFLHLPFHSFLMSLVPSAFHPLVFGLSSHCCYSSPVFSLPISPSMLSASSFLAVSPPTFHHHPTICLSFCPILLQSALIEISTDEPSIKRDCCISQFLSFKMCLHMICIC